MSENRRKVATYPDVDSLGLFSLAAMNSLRLEALDLLDRALAEGKPMLMECFIERQLTQEDPPLDLLSQIAEDVHHKLIALRQSHFEVRDDVFTVMRHEFNVDMSPLSPPQTLDHYHLLSLEDAICFVGLQNSHLTDDERIRLHHTLKASLDSATRLHTEIVTAERLYDYINDWLVGLQVANLRSVWTGNFGDSYPRNTQ